MAQPIPIVMVLQRLMAMMQPRTPGLYNQMPGTGNIEDRRGDPTPPQPQRWQDIQDRHRDAIHNSTVNADLNQGMTLEQIQQSVTNSPFQYDSPMYGPKNPSVEQYLQEIDPAQE